MDKNNFIKQYFHGKTAGLSQPKPVSVVVILLGPSDVEELVDRVRLNLVLPIVWGAYIRYRNYTLR